MRAVDMPALFEKLPIISVVIDFAVVSNIKRAVFVGHWLMTGSDVNDAQAAVAQTDAIVYIDPFIVGTAVSDHIAHPL